MGEDVDFWRRLMPVLANEERVSRISPVTLATICYAASNCDCEPFDSLVRRDVERNFERYAGLFAFLKGRNPVCNPLLMLGQFLDELATRTGVFRVRYASAVDAGFRGSFEWLSMPEVNARYAVVLLKRGGVDFKTPWEDAVQVYCGIMGNPERFLEKASSLYEAIQQNILHLE